MLHISADVVKLEGIVAVVRDHYVMEPQVVQVVAVPLFSYFPTYDFFLVHRIGREWKVVAGHQCKQGSETPSEDAWNGVALSIWIEGKCRKYRVQPDGKHVPAKLHRGWHLMGKRLRLPFSAFRCRKLFL
jgi:hypothetical protein